MAFAGGLRQLKSNVYHSHSLRATLKLSLRQKLYFIRAMVSDIGLYGVRCCTSARNISFRPVSKDKNLIVSSRSRTMYDDANWCVKVFCAVFNSIESFNKF